MRIKAFKFLIRNEAVDYKLQNCDVVIDAQNYFYDIYERSTLSFAFGCESNRFETVLKEHLSPLKSTNLKCYFVFKGGNEDLEKRYEKTKSYASDSCELEDVHDKFVFPVFAMDTCKQVLEQMSFYYVNCPLEAKNYCITLAKKLNCPVISNDIEFAFSKIPYIPYDAMIFDKPMNAFKCVKFHLDHFLSKYALNEEKIMLFVVLTDIHCFPEDYFNNVFKYNRIDARNCYYRILDLLKWLSCHEKESALQNILKYLDLNEHANFMLMVNKIAEYLEKKQGGLPADSFLFGDNTDILRNDPMWFEKGVVNNFIAKPYIDLYYSNIFLIGNNCKKEYVISTDIITYAYNLLTNYTKDHFSINYTWTGQIITTVNTTTLPLSKPEYEAINSVFENGWDDIRSLGLFEYFLKGTMSGIDLGHLEDLPADARLLMISLTYFSFKSQNETVDELYSILLSYVMLGIVFENREDFDITATDCKLAMAVTETYFKVNRNETKLIFNSKMIHLLIEFQHCLEQMNYLNILCGSPYKPTVYGKTYNGTFIYKIFHQLKINSLNKDDFLTNVLHLPRNIIAYLQYLVTIHERLLSSIQKNNHTE